jgi:CxxC motif-containing protein
MGCSLEVDEKLMNVTGNKCKRGTDYAQEEIRAPKRVVTATACLTENSASVRRVPVKTDSPCPREKIPALLNDIYKIKVSLPVKNSDILIADWNGEGINVIATRTLGETIAAE